MTESIVQVVNTLDTYYTVLTAEIIQIDQDMNGIYLFMKRYGNRYWESSIKKLVKLKKEKENLLRDVRLQMELFNIHLESGRELCRRLEKIQPLIIKPFDEQDVVSSQQQYLNGNDLALNNSQQQINSTLDGTILTKDFNTRTITVVSSILANSDTTVDNELFMEEMSNKGRSDSGGVNSYMQHGHSGRHKLRNHHKGKGFLMNGNNNNNNEVKTSKPLSSEVKELVDNRSVIENINKLQESDETDD
ncbi:hypothetical protein ABK040_013655 [Willaertia magna]